MVGQASRLSIANDGQDARPSGNPRGKIDCFAALAMTLFLRVLCDLCGESSFKKTTRSRARLQN